MQKTMMVLKPSPFVSTGFGVIGLIIALPGIDAIMRFSQLGGVVPIIFGITFACGPIFRYQIYWDAELLTYRGLIFVRKIRFSEIRKYDVHGPTTNRFSPTVGLRVFAASSKPVMTINIKPFSRADIALLVGRLNEACGK